jgi:hypothetical protein
MLVVIWNMSLLLSTVNPALFERECAPGAFYNFKRRATPRYLPTLLERTVLDLSFPCPSVCGGSYDVSQFHHVNASHCPKCIS